MCPIRLSEPRNRRRASHGLIPVLFLIRAGRVCVRRCFVRLRAPDLFETRDQPLEPSGISLGCGGPGKCPRGITIHSGMPRCVRAERFGWSFMRRVARERLLGSTRLLHGDEGMTRFPATNSPGRPRRSGRRRHAPPVGAAAGARCDALFEPHVPAGQECATIRGGRHPRERGGALAAPAMTRPL
jgi:hypothetical protein